MGSALLDQEYLSVAEAAALLRVAPSTVRRWIRSGALPGYRVGRRQVALKRDDVSALIARIRAGGTSEPGAAWPGSPLPPLTPEERDRGLAALDRAEQIALRIQAGRGGQPLPPAWETLDDVRTERLRQLP